MAQAGGSLDVPKPSMKDQVPSAESETDQRTDAIGPAPEKHTGIFQSCQWFKENPRKRFLYMVMWIPAAFTIIWLLVRTNSPVSADVISGVMAIVLALFAARHFRILLGLKDQIGKFAKNNTEMKAQNAHLKANVDKLSKKQEELAAVNADLMETSNEYRANIGRFQEIDEKLKTLGDSNIAGLEALQEMSHHVMGSLKKEMIQHQRDILRTTHEAVEFAGDDQEGMNKEEYERFLAALPKEFQLKFQQMGKTFEEIAGSDGLIDLEEFTELADTFEVTDLLIRQATQDQAQ